MKKYLTLLIFIFLFTNLKSQIIIEGQLPIELSTEKLFLSENIGGKYYKIDSCFLINDAIYSFEGDYETGYYSLSLNDSNWVQIIIHAPETLIHIDFNSAILRNGITVLESQENKLLWDFMKNRKRIKSEISQAYTQKTYYAKESGQYINFQRKEDSLFNFYNKYLLQLYKTNPHTFFANTIISDITLPLNNDFFQYTFFQNKDLIRSGVLTRKITEFMQFHTAYTEDGFIESIDYILTKASVNNIVYDFVLNYLLELFNEVGPDIILDYLVEEYVITDACSDLEVSEILSAKLNAYRKLQIGNKAPLISMFDSNGTLRNLNDICLFSKINVVFFGSSHCHFCKDAMPKLEEYSSSFNESELKIIYISLDTSYSSWINEAKHKPKNWVSLSELKTWDSKSVELFQVHKTPSYYILDPNYIIISKPKNIEELLKEMKMLFKDTQ